MKIEKFSLPFLGFLQASGLLVYISFVAFIMLNANKVFGQINTIFGPIAFLLLFVASASISGILVLARASYLFWEKKYKQAFTLLIWTVSWILFYLIAVFSFLYISK